MHCLSDIYVFHTIRAFPPPQCPASMDDRISLGIDVLVEILNCRLESIRQRPVRVLRVRIGGMSFRDQEPLASLFAVLGEDAIWVGLDGQYAYNI